MEINSFAFTRAVDDMEYVFLSLGFIEALKVHAEIPFPGLRLSRLLALDE